MTFMLILLAVVILALLWTIDRQAKRHDEAEKAHRLEMAGLLGRVRSPELHKPEPPAPKPVEVPAVGFDDDEQFWEAKGVSVNGGDRTS